MGRYALLILPSANRVYAEASTALTVAELQAFGGSVLGGRIAGAAAATIGGVPYVTFTADRVGAGDAALLAIIPLTLGFALALVAAARRWAGGSLDSGRDRSPVHA